MEKGIVAEDVCIVMTYYNKYYEGVFWIPENEECKIIATLFIDNEGVATISSLQDILNEKNKTIDGNFSVLGIINSNNESKTFSIKLFDTYKKLQSFSFAGLDKHKYISHNVLIAEGYDRKICEKSYNSVMLNSGLLDNWIPKTGFKRQFEPSERFTANQLYEQPEKIVLFNNDQYHIYVFFRAEAGYPIRRKSFIEEEVFVNIKTSTNYNIDELKKIGKSVEHLFNIILFVPFYSDQIEYRSVSNYVYKSLTKPKELNLHIINEFKFETFLEKSQQIFENWFEKQDKLELIIKNFFSVYGQNGILVENRFLTYISIIENYHRNNVSIEKTEKVLKKYFSTVKFRKYKKEVSATLKQRLIFMFDSMGIASIIDDLNKFAEILVDTRNFHTHLLDTKEEKSLTFKEINRVNELLEVVIREFLLKEIGIDDFNIESYNLPKIETANLKFNKKPKINSLNK